MSDTPMNQESMSSESLTQPIQPAPPVLPVQELMNMLLQQSQLLEQLLRRVELQDTRLNVSTRPQTAPGQTQTPTSTDSSTNTTNPLASDLKNEPKLGDPEPFHGDRKKSRNFLMQCHVKFMGQPSRFDTEEKKIMYAISWLRGTAFSWVAPFVQKNHFPFSTFKQFSEAFTNVFGDIDLVRNAERTLLNLRQGKRPVASLVSDFQRHSIDTTWSESALMSIFYNALNEDVKDELCKIERPEKLDEFYMQAIRIGNRLYERQEEKRKGNHVFIDLPPQIRHESPEGLVPMELDAAYVQGPISEAEKERRKKNGLCSYCGEDGHFWKACPRRSSHKHTVNGVSVKVLNQSSKIAKNQPKLLVSNAQFSNREFSASKRPNNAVNGSFQCSNESSQCVNESRNSTPITKQSIDAVLVQQTCEDKFNSEMFRQTSVPHLFCKALAHLDHGPFELECMMDSGATANFIDEEYALQ